MKRESFSESYKNSGVNIEAGYESVRLIKKFAERTSIAGVLSGIGDFGALFQLDTREMKNPVLVSGTDGVGTKLKIAFILDRHNTIGIDCVAMCVNDILCSLAKPLFFLDYIACAKNEPEKIAAIVEGVAAGCLEAGCALTGGETAEMPGFYREGEYDIAGFCCGAADRDKLIDRSKIRAGCAVLALPSSGVHSNGFSLIRKVFKIDSGNGKKVLDDYKSVLGRSLGEELLTPTRIYVKPVLELAKKIRIYGISHITGGGFYENMPRCLPKPGGRDGSGGESGLGESALTVKIFKDKIKVPPVFSLIQEAGNISGRDMFNTFNMGVGMILIVENSDADTAVRELQKNGIGAYKAGEITAGAGGVVLED